MIDPFSGDDDASQSSGQAEALGVGHELLVQDVEMQQGESSKSAEICKKLNSAFQELTSTDILERYLALHLRESRSLWKS